MKPNRFSVTLAVLVFLVLVAPPALADSADAFGPNAARRQLRVVAPFNGDTMFKQPTMAISQAFGEPRQVVMGSAVVESISGQVMLPRGQHISRVQLVNGITDPVRREVLATLEFTLAAVTDDYAFYTVSLPSPVRIPDANAFSVVVLRDLAATATTRNGEVALMLNILQPR
jgi:hypothetical protein